MAESAWKSRTCWIGAFAFLAICFVCVWLCDGCVEPKQQHETMITDISPATFERYDSIMLAKLDSMNRVNRMESIQAKILMVLWNSCPEYRKTLSPYVKVYADSLLRRALSLRDTFEFIGGAP